MSVFSKLKFSAKMQLTCCCTCISIFELQAIRVIANISINEEAGAGLAASEPLVDLLIQILGKLTLKL